MSESLKPRNAAESKQQRTKPEPPPRQTKPGTNNSKEQGQKPSEAHQDTTSGSPAQAVSPPRTSESNKPKRQTATNHLINTSIQQNADGSNGNHELPYEGDQNGTNVDGNEMEIDPVENLQLEEGQSQQDNLQQQTPREAGTNHLPTTGRVAALVRQHENRTAEEVAPQNKSFMQMVAGGISKAVSYIPVFGKNKKAEVSRNQHGSGRVTEETHIALFSGNTNLQNASFENLQLNVREKELPPDPLQGYTENNFSCRDFIKTMNETHKGCVVETELTWKLTRIPKNTERQDFRLSISLLNESPVVSEKLPTAIKKYTVWNKIQCGRIYVLKVSFYVVSPGHNLLCETPFTFSTIPEKPSNLRLNPQQNRARLKWNACEGAEKFEVKVYATSDKLLQTFSVSGISCDIPYTDDIIMGIDCKFQVIAKFAETQNESEKKTIFIGTDNCPRTVKAKLIDATNKVKVTWEGPNTSVSSYNIKAECPGVKTISGNTQSEEFEFEELTAGSKYTFYVQADFGLFSPSSYWIPSNSVSTESCTIEVEDFEAELNPADPGTSIICKWAKNSDAKCYKIKCSSDDHESTSVVTIGSTFTIKNLYPDTKYKVKIRAKEIRGYGDYGAQRELITGLGRVSYPLVTLLNASRDDDFMPGVQVQFFPSLFPLRNCNKEHIVELRTPGKNSIVRKLGAVENKVKIFKLQHSTEYEAFIKSSCDEKLGEEVSAGKIITVPKTPETIQCRVDKHNQSDRFCIEWEREPGCVEHEIHVLCIDVQEENVLILVTEEVSDIMYICQNVGCAYKVKIRAANASGYSQWSSPETVTTAPAAVEDVWMSFDDDKIVVSWEATRNTIEYRLELFEIKDENAAGDMFDDDKNRPVHTTTVVNDDAAINYFEKILEKFEPTKGAAYRCRIQAWNKLPGIPKLSQKLICALDPPTYIIHEQMDDTVSLKWKPSKGMKRAKILVLKENENSIIAAAIVTENFWNSPSLPRDEHIKIKIYAKNSKAESKKSGQVNFYTAPSQVEVDLDPTYPSTHINVNITSNFGGKFKVFIDGIIREHHDEFITDNLQCQVTNLHPATEYVIVVQNVSDDPKEICMNSYAERVTTDPLKVTGLHCEIVDDQRKCISWDSCGNDQIGYTLECRKDMLVTTTATTETEILLESLEPGRYSFFVKGGSGKFSDPCNITVPESPKFEFKLVTPEHISVICSQVEYADSYEAQIWCEGSEQGRNFQTINGEFWIHHKFECANRYLLKLYAVCEEHKSAVAKQYFYANLEAPTNLRHRLDGEQPSKKARFTWETNDLAKKTDLKLSDSSGNVVGEVITLEKEWEFGELFPNREYILKAHPNDGVRSYAEYTEIKFRTAPCKPDKLVIKKNRAHPETKLDVEIYSDYSGPFILEVKKEYQEKGEEIETQSKIFTLNNLEPGCPYQFYVKCKFIDLLNEAEYFSDYMPFTGKK